MLYIKPYSQVVNEPTKIAGFKQQDCGDTDTTKSTKNRWTRGYFMIIHGFRIGEQKCIEVGLTHGNIN